MTQGSAFHIPAAHAGHLEVVFLQEVDEGDERRPPHHQRRVAQARGDLRQQRVHQGGVTEVESYTG